MERRSQEIIDEKKTALLQGDEDLVHRVGEGKDIMSILRKFVFLASLHPSHVCPVKDNTTASDAEKLTNEELVAQMSCVLSYV